MVRIATLLIHYEIEQLTYIALNNLLGQSQEHDLFVVDCGSSKPLVLDIAGVTVLRLKESLGLSGSINWAMRGLKTLHFDWEYDYIWHYTNDVTSTPGVLKSLVRRLEAYPELAAIQPSMPSWHKHLNPRREGGWEAVRYLEWAAVLMNMAAWQDVGPLDEGFNFFSMDIDWCHRAKQKGWAVAVDYDVRCGHPWRGTHNVTGFSITDQALKEHEYGREKYGREDWQGFLMGTVE